MVVVLLCPVLLSSLIISAHFYRAGIVTLAIVSFALPLVLLYQKPIAVRIIQIFLIVAAAEWCRTMLVYIQIFQNNEMAWYRLAFILGAVIVFTVGSIGVFSSRILKNRYHITRR